MIPHIPEQRKFAHNDAKPFDDLISYIEGDNELEQGQALENGEKQEPKELSSKFSDLLNYATSPTDKNTKAEKCIAIRTHNLGNIKTASREMNAVARENTRCKDPAYHFILSWPEHEKPLPDAIFDAAENALKVLGLSEHQCVIAIHGNTDNMHCHVSVNRIHPITFKSQHLEFAVKNLHMAARQSEIKHGWTHDNGIYIVETNGHGKKHIVLNPEHAKTTTKTAKHGQFDQSEETILPTWHDPDSYESWLKTKVAKSLKAVLPGLNGWYALHAWLDRHSITLTDSGGGGMRLQATSPETGEILDIAASKGLRLLKREQLEKLWGPFTGFAAVESFTPDLKHLTPAQLKKGIAHVLAHDSGANRPPTAILARNPGLGRPPNHVLRFEQHTEGNATERSGGLHDVSTGSLDAQRQDDRVLLQNPLHGRLGNDQAGENQAVRRTGIGETGSRSERSLRRDDDKRAERKQQRAAARADLRQRFAKYRRFVQSGDSAHFLRIKDIRAVKSQALKEIQVQSKAAKAAIPKGTDQVVRFNTLVEINAQSLRRKLTAESVFQETTRSLKATKTPALSWRAWLYEQANLADQAALSALRGIVYQAQRDAKKNETAKDEAELADTEEYQDQQFRKVMARLLEEEKKEAAIRSANFSSMRPYEADALLASYLGIKWRVTGNGNVEYSKLSGDHLFTDRGNRLTFDRVRVSDEEIRLALVHAEHKYGKQLTLTGNDPIFTKRMAQLADDMGMTILNPELQLVITNHREDRKLKIVQAVTINQAKPPTVSPVEIPEQVTFHKNTEVLPTIDKDASNTNELQPQAQPVKTPQQHLREEVLSIDPLATFVIPDPANSLYRYIGPVAAMSESNEHLQAAFAQHTGRSVYALHTVEAPANHADGIIEVQYQNGKPSITVADKGKGKGRSD
jgi:Relaxase/Mobilisation nuclease domain